MTATDLTAADDRLGSRAAAARHPATRASTSCSTRPTRRPTSSPRSRGQVADARRRRARRRSCTGLAEVLDLIGRAGSFAGLDFAADTTDPARGARMQRVEERSTVIGTKLLFFELEWAELADDQVDALLADDRLDVRRAPPALGAPLPAAPADRARRGHPHREGGHRSQRVGAAVRRADVGDHGRARRRDRRRSKPGSRGCTRPTARCARPRPRRSPKGSQPGLRTRAFVLNTLLADKSIDDRLRHFASWIASRNLANEASDESVQALVEAVQGRYSIPQRWYTLKAQLLGIDRSSPTTTAWRRSATSRAKSVGTRRRSSCSTRTGRSRASSPTPRASSSTTRGSTRRRVRASGPARSARTRCRRIIPYLLLNWTSRRRDVLTLAHELGHGLHAYLARGQGVFHQTTPLTLAETASVFGETVTFGRLLETVTDPAERLALLASNLEDQIATVFRQIAMNRFEDAMHTARREEGELSVERFGELWADSQTRDARRLGRDHRGLPHVVVVHPALHRHAGLRVRVRVRPAARAVGVRAVRGGGEWLRAELPRPACARADRCRRRSSARSSASTSPIPASGTAASTSSSAASKRRSKPRARRGDLRDVPRHPVEHRQRRPARAALHRAPSRPRARRPVGALARQGGQGRGGVGRPRAQRRARDQRRRRVARARRRLRVLHRDRRPASRRSDQATWRASSRRARTSCRARSCR